MRNRMRLTVDNEKLEIVNSALVISNSKFTGGGMKIAPMADTRDGKVDLVVFQEVDRRDILSIFARVFKGTHVGHPQGQDLSRRRSRHRQRSPGNAHGRRRAAGPHAAAPEGAAGRTGHPGMKKAVRLAFSLLIWGVGWVWFSLGGLFLLLIGIFRAGGLFESWLKGLCRSLVWICGIRITVSGKENFTPANNIF
ncbi:MAG: hypothetical protein MZV70_60280 [Desulfobacterales bacterium]|nr:hypothetical protein [Desulfobacterales bacterium]